MELKTKMYRFKLDGWGIQFWISTQEWRHYNRLSRKKGIRRIMIKNKLHNAIKNRFK